MVKAKQYGDSYLVLKELGVGASDSGGPSSQMAPGVLHVNFTPLIVLQGIHLLPLVDFLSPLVCVLYSRLPSEALHVDWAL